MQCPGCGSLKSSVLDSRYKPDLNQKRRRRQCGDCGETFTTFERVASSRGRMPRVIKRDGRREAFDHNKIRRGLLLAAAKRPIPTETMEAVSDRVADSLAKIGEKEITAEHIGAVVMRELRRLDHVAYIRFASVYRDFKDAGAFRDEAHAVGRTARAGGRNAQRALFEEDPDEDGPRDT